MYLMIFLLYSLGMSFYNPTQEDGTHPFKHYALGQWIWRGGGSLRFARSDKVFFGVWSRVRSHELLLSETAYILNFNVTTKIHVGWSISKRWRVSQGKILRPRRINALVMLTVLRCLQRPPSHEQSPDSVNLRNKNRLPQASPKHPSGRQVYWPNPPNSVYLH